MLRELMECGAMATDKSYDLCFAEDVFAIHYFEVLLTSGYLLIKRKNGFTLDDIVEECDGEPEEMLANIMSLLKRDGIQVDEFGQKIHPLLVKHLLKLPKLQAGVTHEKNGPFAELKENYLQESDDASDASTEVYKPSPNKKQRVSLA